MRKGFTLIELLVVIVIIGILVAIALPNFIRIKDKAKEAEVKQNLHAIQLATERYSVDSPTSEYPYLVLGGDWTDSYTVLDDWRKIQNLDTDKNISNPAKQGNKWVPATMPLGGDPLIEEAYLPRSPGNPFVKRETTAISTTMPHLPYSGSGAGFVIRQVGGDRGNLMAEATGPIYYHFTFQKFVGDWTVHHIYNNPKYNEQSDINKTPPGGWKNPSGNKWLTGNFQYFPRLGKDNFGAPGYFRATSQVQGYSLAGYGSPRTTGSDVYNRNGNYKGRYRTETCLVECGGFGGYLPDVPCICTSGAAPNIGQNDGGSDTVPDGVVIVLDSGLDKKGSAGQAGVTEGI
jgi:prepilin-type N-terminal cleavage/methylation domain-containing protein